MSAFSPGVEPKPNPNLSSTWDSGRNFSGFSNACRMCVASLESVSGPFVSVREYFQTFFSPFSNAPILPLARRSFDVERAGNSSWSDFEKGKHHALMIGRVALMAAAAGITTAAVYMAHSAAYAGESRSAITGVGEQGYFAPETLSAVLSTTAFIGRKLLSAPTVIGSIPNQTVFPGIPFNFTVDLGKVFNDTDVIQEDVRFTLADGSPLPDWLTTSVIRPLVGSFKTPTTATDVTVVGNYSYVTSSFESFCGSLQIIDVSNKTRPILVGSVSLSHGGSYVTVNNNYAYVTGSNDFWLQIFDVSNKTKPALVEIKGGYFISTTVVGNYLYDATYNGLNIFDVSNKTIPTLVGSVIPVPCMAVSDSTVVGNYAYVTGIGNMGCGIEGLLIVDVSNKTNLTIVGNIALRNFQAITIVGNYAFVGESSTGLQIIDVSNITNPTFLGSVSIPDYNFCYPCSHRIEVVGNHAYISGSNVLSIIDVNNKTNPTTVGTIATSPNAFTVVGNDVYIAGNTGLEIFSITTLLSGNPQLINRGTLPLKLTVTDTLGETLSSYFSITVFDNPPTSPAIPQQTVHSAFNFVIPSFNDIDGDPLTYSATLSNGLPLPNWIHFDAVSRNFSGTAPPVVSQESILVYANDHFGGIGNGTQIINIVDAAPGIAAAALQPTTITAQVPFHFALNPALFSDSDGDPLTYDAILQCGQPLPSWLNFNSSSEVFSGIAPSSSVGVVQIHVTATDPFGETASGDFDLNILSNSGPGNSPPQLVLNPPDITVGVGQNILFQISNNTFVDVDQDPLTWSASEGGGTPLPDWLSFYPTTHFFYGTAPTIPQVIPINVQARDYLSSPATGNFNLIINGAPQLLASLSDLSANVGVPFKFVVPPNTFRDLDPQKAVTYTAKLTTGGPLPGWLSFNPTTNTFSGTPGLGDTNAFSSRALPVSLTAVNDIGLTTANFVITVQGESSASLSLKIISSVGSAFSVAAAMYAKRDFVWKKTMKCMYALPTEQVTLGMEKEYCHTITRLKPEKVESVKLLRDGVTMPGGALRPDWLLYDVTTGKLTIDAKILKDQDGLMSSRWTVRVKNRHSCVNGLVWEEFELQFVSQPFANRPLSVTPGDVDNGGNEGNRVTHQNVQDLAKNNDIVPVIAESTAIEMQDN